MAIRVFSNVRKRFTGSFRTPASPRALTRISRLPLIVRTGSSEPAGTYKKLILELGGSANMDVTVERAVFGKMTNMGQSCIAAQRFILIESVSGARVIPGGKRPSPQSAFFEPTILTNVKNGTPAYDE
jgi:acyl-CoA reductase-like NAD-dependent aldehyde dehydrogenase